MHFPTISLIILTLLTITASAAPTAEIKARDGSSCSYDKKILSLNYKVVLAGGIGDCQAFLGNLRGQCGAGITNWGCGSGNTVTVTFTAPLTCTGGAVGNAIYVSTNPKTTGIDCNASNKSPLLLRRMGSKNRGVTRETCWMEKKTNWWEVVGDELDGPALADHFDGEKGEWK